MAGLGGLGCCACCACLANLEVIEDEIEFPGLYGVDADVAGAFQHNAVPKEACTSDSAEDVCDQLVQDDEPLPGSKRHLVLNFDINKTVLMSDASTGKSLESVVNEELAAAAWGKGLDGRWSLEHAEPMVFRPRQGLVSYAEWVAQQFPAAQDKRHRAALKGRFARPGEPGEALAQRAAGMVASLQLPNGEPVQLIPAFFELVISLKRQRRSFTIVFRTFGTDLESVARDLNSFCEGRHPLYPGERFDGSDGEPDYRLHVPGIESCGTFHREEGQISLIMGCMDQAGEGKFRDVTDGSLAFYSGCKGIRIFKGLQVVSNFLGQKCAVRGTLGFRDYYPYWRSKGMTSEAGKVFLFNPTRETNQHALFFDDNIQYEDFYIAHPISLIEPERKHFTFGLLESHMCKAEPLEAISDRCYFIKAVARLEAGYERKLRARERLRKLATAFRVSCSMGSLLRRISEAAPPVTKDQATHDAWQGLRRRNNWSTGRDLTDEDALNF